MKMMIPLCLVLVAGNVQAQSTSSAEIDAVWAKVSKAVIANDIAALGSVYHPSAVVVTSSGTQPIAAAIEGWGAGMVAAKKAGDVPTVEFRFSKRQHDAETAYEAGIFAYTPKAGETRYTRFEGFFRKQNGRWLMIVEHQLDRVDEAAWNALPSR